MKKALSFVLILVLALSLCVPVFAVTGTENTKGKITINNVVNGTTYKIYKMFDLESFSDDDPSTFTSGLYSYKVTPEWEAFMQIEAVKTYITMDGNKYITVSPNVSGDALRTLAEQYIADHPEIEPVQEITAQNIQEGETGTVVFNGADSTGLELGYYFIDSNQGALCMLTTTNTDAVLNDKNSAPTVKKYVQEDATKLEGKLNHADIGQHIRFTAHIETWSKGTTNLVYHDKMTEGLTLTNTGEYAIKVYDDPQMTTVVDPSKYTIVTESLTDDCDFEIRFDSDFTKALDERHILAVVYYAELNEQAIVGVKDATQTNVNENECYLTYGEAGKTTSDITETYTYQMYINKIETGATAETIKQLPGAHFQLIAGGKQKGTSPIEGHIAVLKMLEEGDSTKATKYSLHDWIEAETTVESGYTTDMVTPASGLIHIIGLDADTYQLEETKAPDGYSKLTDTIEIVIDVNGTVHFDGTTSNAYRVNVENRTGTQLPETGGVGTTMFYIIGGVLAVGAVVLLVTKKRMGSES